MDEKKKKRSAPVDQGEEFWYKKWWIVGLVTLAAFAIGMIATNI